MSKIDELKKKYIVQEAEEGYEPTIDDSSLQYFKDVSQDPGYQFLFPCGSIERNYDDPDNADHLLLTVQEAKEDGKVYLVLSKDSQLDAGAAWQTMRIPFEFAGDLEGILASMFNYFRKKEPRLYSAITNRCFTGSFFGGDFDKENYSEAQIKEEQLQFIKLSDI